MGLPSRQEQRSVIQGHAVQGGVSLAGGIALSIISGIAKIPFIGFIAGVGIAIAGYRMLKRPNKRPGETIQGAVVTAVGAVTAIAGLEIFGALGQFALGVSSFGLIVYGAYRLFQYWRSSKGYN